MAAPKSAFICSACARSLRLAARPSLTQHAASSRATSRNASTTSRTSRPPTSSAVSQAEALSVPRWKRTPERMKMPFRVRPRADQPAWAINEDQQVLDKVLDAVIGSAGGQGLKGRDMFPDEVKWLAVTHKTFEQGARGFNDRLALLGKRIVDIQTSKALLTVDLGSNKSDATAAAAAEQEHGEQAIGPAQSHPDLAGIENVTTALKQRILSPMRVAALAERYGIDSVARWVPRHTDAPERSGKDIVLANTLYAIVGAVALSQGGRVASAVAKERILKLLGL